MRATNWARRVALLLVLVACGAAVAAREKTVEVREDPVALAAMLLADGHLDRAEGALQDPNIVKDERYHRLVGLIALQKGDHRAGFEALGKALELSAVAGEGTPDPTLCLSYARAAVLAGEPAAALEGLDRGGAVVESLAGTPRIRARAQLALGRTADALRALEAGAAAFPQERELVRAQVSLLAELGLYQEALARASGLLAVGELRREEAMTLSEVLRRGGSPGTAAVLLEEALAKSPEDAELRGRAAGCLLEAGRPLAAARVLSVAAEVDGRWADEVAELYRRGGNEAAALVWNGRVTDPKEKARQRFALLLAEESWERALAMEERLTSLGILPGDEEVRYGLGYARIKVGDVVGAERALQGIAEPRLFEQARALREVMSRCSDEIGGCL